jgi:hypothetical protein
VASKVQVVGSSRVQPGIRFSRLLTLRSHRPVHQRLLRSTHIQVQLPLLHFEPLRPSSAFKYSVSCVDASPMHAILVDASGPSLIALAAISAAPVNRLQEPFPATFPVSGKVSVARESVITGLPPRSSRLHCVPVQTHSLSRCGRGPCSLSRFLVRGTSAQHPTHQYTQAQYPHSVFHCDSFASSARRRRCKCEILRPPTAGQFEFS